MIKAIFEFLLELLLFVKQGLQSNNREAGVPPPPTTPKEDADRDIQAHNEAVIAANVDDIMRLHNQLCRDVESYASGAGARRGDTGGQGDSRAR